MRLDVLQEAVGEKSFIDLMGIDDPVNQHLIQRMKEKGRFRRHKLDEFYIRFKPEHGGGYYKIRVKHVKEKGYLYNFGYFDRPYLPDTISFDTAKLTKEGQEDYRRFLEFVKQHPQSTAQRQSPEVAIEREKQLGKEEEK